MIIVRFKLQCQPGKTEEVVAAAAATIGHTPASRCHPL